ncbi:MAG: hypothetical protein R3E91_02200 [Chlamydiales bacterium]
MTSPLSPSTRPTMESTNAVNSALDRTKKYELGKAITMAVIPLLFLLSLLFLAVSQGGYMHPISGLIPFPFMLIPYLGFKILNYRINKILQKSDITPEDYQAYLEDKRKASEVKPPLNPKVHEKN